MDFLSFPPLFKHLIYQCISSTSIAVRFNQTKTSYFHPGRGLKQRDPLSPLLFLLCIQGLTALIQHSLNSSKCQTLTLKNQNINITYLDFSEDIILFCKGNDSGLSKTLNVLKNFCVASGQKIKFSKSLIIFNKHMTPRFKEYICSVLNMAPHGTNGSYLGILFSYTMSKRAIFKALVYKMNLKINFWHQHYLSKPGKLVMIQSILHASLLHIMSCINSQYTSRIRWINLLEISIGRKLNLNLKSTG